MTKLYKFTDTEKLYWETWDNFWHYTVHWGSLGTRGQSKLVMLSLFSSAKTKVEAEMEKMKDLGYVEIEDEVVLMIEYKIEGMGDSKDIDKRHRLESLMNDVLGWTGLGHCDGGSIGSGTMEVCCMVVDFDMAQKVVADSLKSTEFRDYTRIYDENDG